MASEFQDWLRFSMYSTRLWMAFSKIPPNCFVITNETGFMNQRRSYPTVQTKRLRPSSDGSSRWSSTIRCASGSVARVMLKAERFCDAPSVWHGDVDVAVGRRIEMKVVFVSGLTGPEHASKDVGSRCEPEHQVV